MRLFIGCKPHGHDASIYAYIPEINRKYAISTERITRVKHDHSSAIFALENFTNQLEKKIKNKIKNIYFGISFKEFEGYHPINNFKDGHYSISNVFLCVLNFFKLNKFLNEKKYITFFKKKFKKKTNIEIKYFDHEYCHNLSSIYSSNFKEGLSLSMDGMGDFNNFSSIYLFKNDKISFLHKYYGVGRFMSLGGKRFGCSLPSLYEFFTFLVGLKPNSEEGKVEALAAYGRKTDILKNLRNFIFFDDKKNIISIKKKKLERFFNKKNCLEIKKKYKKVDLCFAIQAFSEEIVLKIIKYYSKKYVFKNICLSGGLFANVIINLKIFKELNKNIHVVPAMADDGSAEGACYALLKTKKEKIPHYTMPYIGPNIQRSEVFNELKKNFYKYDYKIQDLKNNWPKDAAKELSKNKIICVFQGKMEWGPRALGNRSILANPRFKINHKKLNQNIKGRPLYQPFCPMILEEDMNKMFAKYYNNFHMTCAFEMKKKYAQKYPVAVHVDNTSRVQVITKKTNLNIYKLLKSYKRKFGEGIIINTSFNKHGRTIVRTVNDAIFDFFDSNIDYLYIEGYKIIKN